MAGRIPNHFFLQEQYRPALYRNLHEFSSDRLLSWAEMVANGILPFIQRGIVNLTAHDINHCIRVIENVNTLADLLNTNGANVSQTETRLLYLAGWLHDIGNLRCTNDTRGKHSEESQKMIMRLVEDDYFLQVSRGLFGILGNIVLCHQSNHDLGKLNEECRIDNDRVRPRMLSALFRLADACHMGPDRASSLVYFLIEDQLLDIDRVHWKANNAIMSVDFEPGGAAVTVTVTNKAEAEIIVSSFVKEFHETRKYLSPYFSYNTVNIHEVTSEEIESDPLRQKPRVDE